jgi:hypothetical protein
MAKERGTIMEECTSTCLKIITSEFAAPKVSIE